MAKRFYLYQRKREGKPPVWYVKFRTAGGSFRSICSECTDKKDAESWAIDRLVEAEQQPVRGVTLPTFAEWAAAWWIPGRCPYLTEKAADGYQVSPAYAQLRRGFLVNHLLPELRTYRLDRITPQLMRDFKMRLYQGGSVSPGTINGILGTARIMFNYAVANRILEYSPVAGIRDVKETPRERGILSLAELRSLFDPATMQTVWSGDLRHYAANLLAATGGLRLGEVQGLQRQYVFPGYVRVMHGWSDRYGLTETPKWNSVRPVPIPRITQEALDALMAIPRWGPPEPEDIVIWGQDRRRPLSKTALLRMFKSALKRIGVSPEEQKRRVLVFHSWRHQFNTMIRGKVPDEQLRRVTGHKTLAMTDSYDKPGVEHLRDVAKAQEQLFPRS